MRVVIKTFMRPWSCERAVASVRKYHPNAYLVVVDDSLEGHAYDCDQYTRLPFDSGLSAGRNAGVTSGDTVLLMDDDLELTSPYLPEQTHDIVCGAFGEDGLVRHYEHTFSFDYDENSLTLVPAGPGTVDIGHNLMLAKPGVFDRVKWDERFKIEAEHLDFFIACKMLGVSVGYDPKFAAIHHCNDKPAEYAEYRFRKDGYRLLLQKWCLRRIYDTEGRVWE